LTFADVYFESVKVGKRIRLRPLPGQARYGQKVPMLWISGNKKIREEYPIGTVFMADLKLIEPERAGNYLKVSTAHPIYFPYEEGIKRSKNGQLKII